MQIVTIYSKPGCCLCDDAKQIADGVKARWRGDPFEIVVKNIEQNARDFAAYQFAIPVIFVAEREIARYRLTEQQLVDALLSPTTATDARL